MHENSDDQEPSGERNVEEFLTVARERFRLAEEAESEFRKVAQEDVEFSIGKQWPEQVKRDREADGRPVLTFNRLPQSIRQVTNDQRQNRPAIKVGAVDDQGDIETAKIIQGLIRHIEYNSNADIAYDTAFDGAARTGLGYWRITPDYVDPLSFDQELLIKRIRNPRAVFFDPHSQEPDGADAQWAFIVDDIPKDDYKNAFKNSKLSVKGADWDMYGKEAPGWITESTCRIAEYFYKDYEDIELVLLSDGTTLDAAEFSEELKAAAEAAGVVERGRRPSKKCTVKWAKINGSEILEETTIPGRYIPVVPVIGDEIDVNGVRILEGIVRHAKDAQRMYNYFASCETEAIALAPKAPYIGAEGQFKGHEHKWQTANRKSHAYLEYNSKGPNAGLPPPQRQTYEAATGAITNARMQASEDIKATTGIYDAALGNRSNETSGRAINARRSQAQTSNFHLIDNLSRSLRHTGRILIDMIPHVYDTARAVRIIGEDGEQKIVRVNDPAAAQKGEQKHMFDLLTGKYDVTVESGPSFATKRQEAVESMLEFIRVYPQAAPMIGDLMVKNMDWAGAQEIAERLKKTIPPNILGEDEKGKQPLPPEAQQQMEQMGQMIEQLTAQLNAANEEKKTKSLERESKERIEMAKLETTATIEMAKLQSKEALQMLAHQIAELDQRFAQLHGNVPFESEQDFSGQMPDQQMPAQMQQQQPTGGQSPGQLLE